MKRATLQDPNHPLACCMNQPLSDNGEAAAQASLTMRLNYIFSYLSCSIEKVAYPLSDQIVCTCG